LTKLILGHILQKCAFLFEIQFHKIFEVFNLPLFRVEILEERFDVGKLQKWRSLDVYRLHEMLVQQQNVAD
jgi:hypothetical protein